MSSIRKRFVGFARSGLGAVYLISQKPLKRSAFFAFVFHEISDTPRDHAIDTETFSGVSLFGKQLHWIKSEFDLLNLKDSNVNFSLGSAIVSFDDGYRGVLTTALPKLIEFQIPAICFINMETIRGGINSSALAMFIAQRSEKSAEWKDSNPRFFTKAIESLDASEIQELIDYQGPYMNEKELAVLGSSPWIALGDHLNNHWFADELTMHELVDAIDANRTALSTYPSYREYMATPHAVANLASLQVIASLGYKDIFSGRVPQRQGEMNVRSRIDMNASINTKLRFYGAIATYLVRMNLEKYLYSRRSL